MRREELFLLILLWACPFVLAGWLGTQKGRMGWLYGLLLGWIGVFILAYLDDNPRGKSDSLNARGSFVRCPHCGLFTPAESAICRHCRRAPAPPATE